MRTLPSEGRGAGTLGGFAVLALAVMVGCGAPSPAATEVRLGATLPLTGADASRGIEMRRGYERAVALVNAEGGLQVRAGARLPVRLDLRDDRALTPVAEQAVEEMRAAGVHVLLATSSAVRATAQALAADRAGVPFVGNVVDAAGLPGARMTWVFTVPASGDGDTRAFQTAKAALDAIARADGLDPTSLRLALAQ